MDEDDLENFEETVRRGRNRSIKAQLVIDDDDDDEVHLKSWRPVYLRFGIITILCCPQ